jgi:hypothetical protein
LKKNLPKPKTEEKGKKIRKYTVDTVNIVSEKVVTTVHKHPAMQARCKWSPGMYHRVVW